jgi:uncharacterized Tic20 family protein
MTVEPLAPAPGQEERNWAMIAHLGPAVAALVSAGFLGFLVPLIVYLVEQERSEFVRAQAKESLNFRITVLIAYVILGVLAIPAAISVVGLCCLVPLWGAVLLADVLLGVLAAVEVHAGRAYRYPFALRLIR